MSATPADQKNFGFVINNRNCIGCHACSTACKSENDVPLGVYRTWVKYTEVGQHPNSRRQFQVTRCNHCANPPCVRICPVTAMYQRDDGIVEFDPDVCIGCKACLQACPYDAIHIDPASGTAAKCHYCAHRVEVGMEPACVVVCPTHAIVAGDMNDPNSEISKVLAGERTTVRKPEQGTAPKLFYIEGDDITMHPTATQRAPQTFMWADVVDETAPTYEAADPSFPAQTIAPGPAVETSAPTRSADSGVSLRPTQTQGLPEGGPIQIAEGRHAGQMVQVAYNAQHKVPWHWQVPAYLVTKAIGSGVFLFLALAWLAGLADFSASLATAGSIGSVAFLLATTALLVADLERPERFLSIVFRPQTKSWLARGAFILIGFSGIATGWAAVETAAWMGMIDAALATNLRPWLLGLGTPLAIGTAIYTAFLFGQAEGRDLWQSPLLPFHLLVQAGLAGVASIAILALFVDLPGGMASLLVNTFVALLAVDLFVTLLGEFGMPHASEIAARAAHEISHGKYIQHFWVGAILLGHIVPIILLVIGFPMAGAAAGVLTLIGLYAFEHAFVMAPQEIQNS